MGGGGGWYLKSVLKHRRVEGVPKLMNLERKYFLNGPHPEIVGFIYFNENPLKMMNVLYLIWKLLFIKEKRLDKKAKVNLKIYDATNWNTKNYNKHIAKYLKKQRQLKHI